MHKHAIFVIILLSALLAGCASGPQNHQTIVNDAASTLEPPQEKLSKFSNFTLAPMKVSDPIQADEKKAKIANLIEDKLSLNLSRLLANWNQSLNASNRKILIEPELLSLRVISGSSRYWAGPFAGNSSIQLKLTILDIDSNTVIGSPVISKEASSLAGAWSTGATDLNLLGYIVDISVQYLKNNY